MPDGGFLPEQPKPALETPEVILDPEILVHEQERLALEAEAEKEKDQHFLEETAEDTPTSQVVVSAETAIQSAAAVIKDDVQVEVERILEDGLDEHFKKLPDAARERFQQKGVEVASRIATMVRALKVQSKRVILLIREWLLTIPGVNKFFLEQEAKIKTDRILELEREHRSRSENSP